ncbi:MAG: hypothetical protein EXR49_02325 [Dehalococcoidia bacterium]|nr:hypothetical protein [Dehalococcoidia bacterium]
MSHAVIFVHGIGSQGPHSSRGFERALRRTLHNLGGAGPALSQSLLWEEAYWASVTQPEQEDLSSRISFGGTARRFMIEALGDVVAYAKLPYPPDKYTAIQARFMEAVQRLGQRVPEGEPLKLTVVSHSLGTVIASDALYDLEKRRGYPPNTRLESLFTLGSPLALFALRYGTLAFNKPVRPPRWENYYYTYDSIGYPLRTLNDAHAAAVTRDVALSPMRAWTPPKGMLLTAGARLPVLGSVIGLWLHSRYFHDPRVLRPIAQALVQTGD